MSDEKKRYEEEEENGEDEPQERFRRLTGSLESPAEDDQWDGEWLELPSDDEGQLWAGDLPGGLEHPAFDPDRRDRFPGITDTDIMAADAPPETSLSSTPHAEEPAPAADEQAPKPQEPSGHTPPPPPPLGTTPLRKLPKLDAQDMPLPQRVPLSERHRQ
jgi:hypothetical protein